MRSCTVFEKKSENHSESARTITFPVSLLMPVCNEIEVIESVITEWVEVVFQYLPEGSEILIDEAASSDGTKDILKGLAAKFPFLKVTYNDQKDGFRAAALRLYKTAKCPIVFFTDSDGQYVAADFWKLAPWIEEFDFVRGAKIARMDPLIRRFASFVFNRLVWFLFFPKYSDVNCAFHMIKRDVLLSLIDEIVCLPVHPNAELLLRAELGNISIKQVYIFHRSRQFGKSKGLPDYRLVLDSLMAIKGLYDIKKSYLKLKV